LSLAIVAAAVVLGNLSAGLVLLPIYLVILGLFAVGVGWIAASLQVYLRDTSQVLSVLLTFWFWLTPVFIPEDRYAKVPLLLRANPLSYLVRAYRDILLFNRIPSVLDLATVAVYAIATFLLGGLFFRHMKRGFADVL
jgi:lipopolysaccharide transport system permease protein